MKIPNFPLLNDASRLDRRTKASLETLHQTMRSRSASQTDLHTVLALALRELRREEYLAGFDPIQRILSVPWKRTYINAAVRSIFAPKIEGIKLTEGQQEVLRTMGKALGEDTSPGSLLISEAIAPELYDLVWQSNALKTLAVIELASKVNKFAVLTAPPVAVFLVTEAGTMDDDANVASLQSSADAEFIGALLNISEQWLTDASVDLSHAFLLHFEEAFQKCLEAAVFNGNGVADATNGGITGIFQHTDPTVITAGAGNTTVGELDHVDIANTVAAAAPAVLQRNPRFWAHPAFLPQLMKVRDAGGNPVLKVSSLEENGSETLFSLSGFPLTLSAGCPSTNAAASRVLAFGDGRAMAVGIRSEFFLQASEHHKFNSLQRSYRGVGRATASMRKGSGFSILKTAPL